jgi:hypothetical protein
VVSVVASDLIDAGFLAVRTSTSTGEPTSGAAHERPGGPGSTRPDRQLLQEVLDGLQRLGEAASGGAA